MTESESYDYRGNRSRDDMPSSLQSIKAKRSGVKSSPRQEKPKANAPPSLGRGRGRPPSLPHKQGDGVGKPRGTLPVARKQESTSKKILTKDESSNSTERESVGSTDAPSLHKSSEGAKSGEQQQQQPAEKKKKAKPKQKQTIEILRRLYLKEEISKPYNSVGEGGSHNENVSKPLVSPAPLITTLTHFVRHKLNEFQSQRRTEMLVEMEDDSSNKGSSSSSSDASDLGTVLADCKNIGSSSMVRLISAIDILLGDFLFLINRSMQLKDKSTIGHGDMAFAIDTLKIISKFKKIGRGDTYYALAYVMKEVNNFENVKNTLKSKKSARGESSPKLIAKNAELQTMIDREKEGSKENIRSFLKQDFKSNLMSKSGFLGTLSRFGVPDHFKKKWYVKYIMEAFVRGFVTQVIYDSFQDISINAKASLNEATVLWALNSNGFSGTPGFYKKKNPVQSQTQTQAQAQPQSQTPVNSTS